HPPLFSVGKDEDTKYSLVEVLDVTSSQHLLKITLKYRAGAWYKEPCTCGPMNEIESSLAMTLGFIFGPLVNAKE
ncbi:hypothetical protein BDFB_013726, partial [Asbolus verrucosus]